MCMCVRACWCVCVSVLVCVCASVLVCVCSRACIVPEILYRSIYWDRFREKGPNTCFFQDFNFYLLFKNILEV